MHLSLHKTLLSLLICSLACPALHADTASSTPVKSDINQAQITDGDFKFPGITASVTPAVASIPSPVASIPGKIPVQEIPAIDNLLQIATQTQPQPQIKTLTESPVPLSQRARKGIRSARIRSEAAASGSIALKPGRKTDHNVIPFVASTSAAIAEKNASTSSAKQDTGAPGYFVATSAVFSEPATGTANSSISAAASSGVALTASLTAETKDKKGGEYIDTLFPDPLSPDFPSESGISDAEKNRPAKEVIDEINQKAEEIAERTARELGIEYIPPAERLPKNEPGDPEESGDLTASASGDLEPEMSEVASGEAKVATEVDSGSWEYPGDTRASAAAEIKKPLTARPDQKVKDSDVKENEITEEPENNSHPGTESAKTSDSSAAATKPITPETVEKGNSAAPVGATEHGKSVKPGKLHGLAEPVKPGKLVESTATVGAGMASGLENTGEETAVDVLSLASETVVTDTENEIIPVQWPDSTEDPEFASGSQQLFSEKTASATSSDGELPGLFEKTEALAPALMTRGKPEDELSEANEIKTITGRLVPEKQPLGRRRHLYRWVLKTDDGGRIPLKSNLKLLTEVRNEKMLDGKVNLSGHFIKSSMNRELQYFVVDSATFADASTASGTADVKTGKPSGAEKKGSGKKGRQPVKAIDKKVNPLETSKSYRQPSGTKNTVSKPAKTSHEAYKIDSGHNSDISGTKNANKKQDLPSGDLNLKKAPMPEQP